MAGLPMRKLDDVGVPVPNFLTGRSRGLLSLLGALAGLWVIWMLLGFIGIV